MIIRVRHVVSALVVSAAAVLVIHFTLQPLMRGKLGTEDESLPSLSLPSGAEGGSGPGVKGSGHVSKEDMLKFKKIQLAVNRLDAIAQEQKSAWAESDPIMQRLQKKLDEVRELDELAKKVTLKWEKTNEAVTDLKDKLRDRQKLVDVWSKANGVKAECFSVAATEEQRKICGKEVWGLSERGEILTLR